MLMHMNGMLTVCGCANLVKYKIMHPKYINSTLHFCTMTKLY